MPGRLLCTLIRVRMPARERTVSLVRFANVCLRVDRYATTRHTPEHVDTGAIEVRDRLHYLYHARFLREY